MSTPVEEIKSKLDIVDLIQEYTPLKQSGINLKGLCPFHNEKTPSFMVSRERQFFKCFGCGEGGDIFTFLQKIENIEFPEALKILADKAGIKLIKQNYNPAFENLKTRLYALHETVVAFYVRELNSPVGSQALKYLRENRGLDQKTIQDFQLGYARDSWDSLSNFLKSQGYSDAEIKQSGLVAEKNNYTNGRNYYDRFRNRIMFPILDHHGNVVGFTARAMNQNEVAKYINTPQTLIYNKSQVLFGLDKAKNAIREKGYVVLVEGNMDVIASNKAGVKNVVASSGTALTSDQLKIIKRYTENIALCFDTDSAGIKAAERGVELIWQANMNVKVVLLPAGFKDPDELIKKNPLSWVAASQKLINFMDYLIAVNLANKNLTSLDVKRSLAGKLLPWLRKITNPIDQEHYLKTIANRLNIAESTLWETIKKDPIYKNPTSNLPSQNKNNSTKSTTVKIDKEKIISERLLATILGREEYLLPAINKLLPEMLFLEYEEFYKEMIFWYTKNNNFKSENFYNSLKEADKKQLVYIFETLKLLFDTEITELPPAEIGREFNLAVNFLRKVKISARLKEIENELRNAEREGNRGRADSLMQEFSELSREISN